jgi:hypothetical protein
MAYEAFICCYFNHDDRNCVGVHILLTLFHSDFSNAMSFSGGFSQASSREASMLKVILCSFYQTSARSEFKYGRQTAILENQLRAIDPKLCTYVPVPLLRVTRRPNFGPV